MDDKVSKELAVLSDAHLALAQAKTVEDVKALRDKAEAARKYAECAKLGLEKQNQCAEYKLSCERKAGRLLIEMGVSPGRPGMKKRSHHGTILADLGINKNQSSRWQQEAQVPEELLQLYIATAREEGQEITAQGLLRLAQQQRAEIEPMGLATKNPRTRFHERQVARAIGDHKFPNDNNECRFPSEAIELVVELLNHHGLLSDNLREFCEKEAVRPKLVQRRTVARLLAESKELLTALREILRVQSQSRPVNRPTKRRVRKLQ